MEVKASCLYHYHRFRSGQADRDTIDTFDIYCSIISIVGYRIPHHDCRQQKATTRLKAGIVLLAPATALPLNVVYFGHYCQASHAARTYFDSRR